MRLHMFIPVLFDVEWSTGPEHIRSHGAARWKRRTPLWSRKFRGISWKDTEDLPKMIGHWPQVVYIPQTNQQGTCFQPSMLSLKNKHLLHLDSIDGELRSCFFQKPLPEEPKPPPKAGCWNVGNFMGWRQCHHLDIDETEDPRGGLIETDHQRSMF